MATLNITTTQDFTSTVFNPLVNLIQFGNPLATTAQGTFRASQFNNVNISSSVSIAGSDGANIVRVAMLVGGPASFSAAAWSFFSNWGTSASSGDRVVILGSRRARSSPDPPRMTPSTAGSASTS